MYEFHKNYGNYAKLREVIRFPTKVQVLCDNSSLGGEAEARAEA
jgi:hypothetical protein